MKFFFLSLFISLSSLASEFLVETRDLSKRPPAFATDKGLAIFTDFTNAYYEVTYDQLTKKAMVRATIHFKTAEEGLPVFDSLAEPTLIEVNGQEVSAALIATPDKKTLLRVIDLSLPVGSHVMTIKLPLDQMVEFTDAGVKSAFWMGDLDDRSYIEKYLPTNFIFDRIPMILGLKFKGGNDNQRIYTNGSVTKLGPNDYQVAFQKDLNNTCPYFHTVPEGSFLERTFTYHSMDGRKLPSVIYIAHETPDPEAHLNRLQKSTITIMDELEKDYGPFPHQSLTIYNNAPNGGMEYSGATITSENALGHELFHSYFARGVMPANGNSGWIDEALARWRDNGYRRLGTLSGSTKMANLGTYSRLTDRLAYSFGEKFMALIDHKMQDKGGLKPFLRHLVEKRSFDPMSTEDFIREINAFYGVDLTSSFRQFVYGDGQLKRLSMPEFEADHHVHRQLTDKELREML